MTNLTHKYLIL